MTTNTNKPARPSKASVRDIIARLKKFRRGHRLDGLSIRRMIDEGRR